MRICSNCGATNETDGSPICRKCGALLPVSSKKKRIRIPTSTKEEEKKPEPKIEPIEEKKALQKKKRQEKKEEAKVQFSAPKDKESKKKEKKFDLQEIPKADLKPAPKPKVKPIPSALSEISAPPKIQVPPLKPVTPQPFDRKILAPIDSPQKTKGMALEAIPLDVNDSKTEVQAEKVKLPPIRSEDIQASINKAKRLEEDMAEVLGFLSKKLDIPKKKEEKAKPKEKKEKKEKITPSSMEEILKQLLSLDLHIEAAAVIKRDGKIIASAVSSRMSDSLFATIGQNLSMIGTDIIHGLSAGDLKSISVKGTSGILDLAPIDQDSELVKDMILIIFSHPKVKSGIIAFAVNIIRKQIIEYLGKVQ